MKTSIIILLINSLTITNSNIYNMEIPNHNSDRVFDEDLYTIEWSDIENTEIDYDCYLNDIEHFFRQDVENEVLEKDVL